MFKATEDDVSDAEYIINELRALGYAAFWTQHDCREFGSLARRERIYLIGCRDTRRDMDDEVLSMVHSLTSAFKRDPLDIFKFVARSMSDCTHIRLQYGFRLSTRAHTKGTEKAAFRDEHFEMFSLANIEWPVDTAAWDTTIFRFDAASVGERATEEIVMLHKVFPPKHLVEFCDVNSGLSYHLGFKLGSGKEEFEAAVANKTPWLPFPACMISHSKIAMRWLTPDGYHAVRVLDGWEHMAMIGWAPQDWNTESDGENELPSNECMISMAGNAFSGFAVAPVLASGLLAVGMSLNTRSGAAHCGDRVANEDDESDEYSEIEMVV